MAIKHRKVSAVPDGGDTSLVRPSDWNDTHEFLVGSQRLVGNATGAPAEAQDVALASGNGFLTIDWSTGTVTFTVTGVAAASHNQAWSTITATPTTLAGYGITDAAALTGATFTGSVTFSNPDTKLSATAPRLDWIETDAAADNGRWRLQADNGQLNWYLTNDAVSVFTTFLEVTRSGTAATAFNVQTTLQQNGNAVWHAGNFDPTTKADTTHNHNGVYEPVFAKAGFVRGSGARLSGTLTARLYGAGDVTIAAGGAAVVTLSSTAHNLDAATHADRFLLCSNASPQTLTILNDSAGLWQDEAQLEGCQYGAGKVTVVAGSGVTLRRFSGHGAGTAGQYAPWGAKRIGANEWLVFGALESA